jgi:putative membrane protein
MKHFEITALAAALLSLGFAFPASAQAPTTPPATPAPTTTAPSTAPTATTTTPSTATTKSGALAKSDRDFMTKAAQDNMAEVELGKLAQQKATKPEVKQFGERMVQDHTKANDELRQVASAKGVTLPAGLDKKHQRKMDELQKKSASRFDHEYMEDMVKEHKKDVSEFRKQSKSAKDADVKAFAAKTLPTLEEHLRLAQDTSKVAK